jgi:hypothetical protein
MSNSLNEYRGGEKPVSTGDWVLTFFLVSIPLIGLILLCVWAFGGGLNESKSNWAKATLIWICLGFALAVGFYLIILMLALATQAA